jgi:hypothetical protein
MKAKSRLIINRRKYRLFLKNDYGYILLNRYFCTEGEHIINDGRIESLVFNVTVYKDISVVHWSVEDAITCEHICTIKDGHMIMPELGKFFRVTIDMNKFKVCGEYC